jgi:hypothetical protein
LQKLYCVRIVVKRLAIGPLGLCRSLRRMDDVVRNWIEYVLSETRPRLREREDEFFLLGWETKFFFSLGGWGGGGDGDIVDALGG